VSSSWQVLVVALWLVVVFQTALVLVLYRQVGLVYLGRAPARSRDGLPLYADAPDWEASDQRGARLTSAALKGRPLVVVFADPDCRPCQRLMPELRTFSEKHREQINVVVIASDDEQANRDMIDRYLLQIPVLHQRDSELKSKFGVTATPFAYFIDREGRIREKGIVNSATQIERKLEALGRPIENRS
jgi:methylamine dehydrogenase accessory protein MauD